MEKIIVLLHGFGEDHHIFDKQVEILKNEYRVFTPDLPGSGTLSQHNWETGTETIEWMADWVNLKLDAQQITSCTMLGHSMGGYITLAFAEKYPEKLIAFGLLHSTAFADSDAKKETRGKAIDFISKQGPHAFLKTAIPGLFGKKYTELYPEGIEKLVEDAQSFTASSLTAYYKAMIARPDRSDVLKKAQVPVLIVAGTEDNAAPLADLLQQAPLPGICHFHMLPDTGHMGMVETPEILNLILLNFNESV